MSGAGVRALGIDPGTKRIGIALSDSGGVVASPFAVLQRSRSRRHDLDEIAKLVSREEADVVVVGLPLSMSGEVGRAAKAAIELADQLATLVNVPVELHDERLTTVAADRSMLEAGLKAPERRKVVDKVAAALMLQSWLDAAPARAAGEHAAPDRPETSGR